MLFVSNFQSSSGSDGSDTIIYAENSGLGSVLLPIEHVGKVPGFDWLYSNHSGVARQIGERRRCVGPCGLTWLVEQSSPHQH